MTSEVVLEIRDLRTHFFTSEGTVKAVDGVTFDLRQGEIIGLVGESGSGKSATALSILRLIDEPGRIVGGQILFEGENLLSKSENEMRKIRGGQISMVFQDPKSYLSPYLTIGAQLEDTMKLHRERLSTRLNSDNSYFQNERGSSVVRKRSVALMKDLLISDPERVLKQYPHQLSGGMNQRAMIAIALSLAPKVIIADEPTTNLDVTVQAQILELLKELASKTHTSLILITHDMGIVAELCDRVVVMYAGQIIENASSYAIFSDPKHPYTKALLEATPRLDTTTDRLPVISGSIPNLISPPTGCRFHPRCPFVFQRCLTTEPAELSRGNESRKVRCHLYDN